MRFEEIRIEMTAASKERVRARVSFGNVLSKTYRFLVPSDIKAAGILNEWFDSFRAPQTPASKLALGERRRAAGVRLFLALFGRSANRFRKRLISVERSGAKALRLRLILGDLRGEGNRDASKLLSASSLPWELMVDPENEQPLARSRIISIVRTFGSEQPPKPVRVSGGLRVLLANAEPRGAAPLGWQAEVDGIREALENRTDTTVEFNGQASFAETCLRLRKERFHVFHFIGHGGFDAASGQWYLLFEKDGERQPILAEDLADRLGDLPDLRLVVLNACHSGELAKETGGNPLASIAAAISAHGVAAVVGMQVAVTDSAAVDFSSAFYLTLGGGEPIETAVADGRASVPVGSPEWATPVFYMNGETSEMFEFGEPENGIALRGEGPRELVVGIRTFVDSDTSPHLAEWAKHLRETSGSFLPLEEFFDRRFIRDEVMWNREVLPRLERKLAEVSGLGRPLALHLAAHATVAFAAGYFFHRKSNTPVALYQWTSQAKLRWSETEGETPKGRLWEPFDTRVLDVHAKDIAVTVEISNPVTTEVESYLDRAKIPVGQRIRARIQGGTGPAVVRSGAHAAALAKSLFQYLKDVPISRGERKLHLFISAPNSFAFYFGQLARSLTPVQMYEYDFDGERHCTYEPSLALPSPAVEAMKS